MSQHIHYALFPGHCEMFAYVITGLVSLSLEHSCSKGNFARFYYARAYIISKGVVMCLYTHTMR